MTQTPEGRHSDVRPIPDPTLLTTEASTRLEKMLRELIQSEIGHLDELFSEKLATIDMRLNGLDARTAEQKSDMKGALDAALAAQKDIGALQNASFKENIAKSETAATERIKSVETLLATSSMSTDDKISDLKDRVIAIEAVKLGGVEQTAHIRNNMASIIGVVTAIVAVTSIIITIIVFVKH